MILEIRASTFCAENEYTFPSARSLVQEFCIGLLRRCVMANAVGLVVSLFSVQGWGSNVFRKDGLPSASEDGRHFLI